MSVQSVRDLKSKMRFHIQKLSYVDVDIIQARDIWKLTGIHEKVSAMELVKTPWYPLFEKIANLVERLCGGQEINSELWKILESVFQLYTTSKDTHHFELLEILIVARILYSLGYWESDSVYIKNINNYTEDVLHWVNVNKVVLVQKINQALKDTQL